MTKFAINPIYTTDINNEIAIINSIMQDIYEDTYPYRVLKTALSTMLDGIENMKDLKRTIYCLGRANVELHIETESGIDYPYDTEICVVQDTLMKLAGGNKYEDILDILYPGREFMDEDFPF